MADNIEKKEKNVEELMQLLREHPEMLEPMKTLLDALKTEQKLLTIPELETILRTTRRTIYKWIDNGEIRAFKVGRSWRVDMEDLKAFLMSRKSNREK